MPRLGPSSRPFRSAFSLREYIVVFRNNLYAACLSEINFLLVAYLPALNFSFCVKVDQNSLVHYFNFRVLWGHVVCSMFEF